MLFLSVKKISWKRIEKNGAISMMISMIMLFRYYNNLYISIDSQRQNYSVKIFLLLLLVLYYTHCGRIVNNKCYTALFDTEEVRPYHDSVSLAHVSMRIPIRFPLT